MPAATNDESTFESFTAWSDVLAWVASGDRVYYRGPLDVRPWLVTCKLLKKSDRVRVTPGNGECSPFSADASHADRFFRRPRALRAASRALAQ